MPGDFCLRHHANMHEWHVNGRECYAKDVMRHAKTT